MVESSAPRSSVPPAGFFRMPGGLFVRLSGGKGGPSVDGGAVDPDSVWSPTSPLDLRNSLLRSSPPPRVGLGLVDALAAGSPLFVGGKASFLLDSIRPFLDPCSAALPKPPPPQPPAAASVIGVAATTTPDDGVADSEEYTCVIARGANPRTTHILGGGETTLEVRGGPAAGAGCRKKVVVAFTVEPFADRPSAPPSPAAGVASGRCGCCMRRLPENKDIFIYKGEKAFCSNECREGYIEEEVEDAQDLMTLEHGSSTAFFLGEDW